MMSTNESPIILCCMDAGTADDAKPRVAGPARCMLYERHGGAAAVAAAAAAGGRAAAAAAYSDSDDEGEEQTCTCGQCLDGWLSLAFSTAVAAVAAKAR